METLQLRVSWHRVFPNSLVNLELRFSKSESVSQRTYLFEPLHEAKACSIRPIR